MSKDGEHWMRLYLQAIVIPFLNRVQWDKVIFEMLMSTLDSCAFSIVQCLIRVFMFDLCGGADPCHCHMK